MKSRESIAPDWPAIELVAADVLRAIAPETFGDIPIVFTQASGRNMLGCTSSLACSIAGGFGLSFSPEAMLESEIPETLEPAVIGLAIHEAAHAVVGKYLHRPGAARVNDGLAAAYFVSLDQDGTKKLTAGDIAKWEAEDIEAHGPAWLRLALHMTSRAIAHGQTRLTPGRVCAARHGHRHSDCYLRALGDEPTRMARRALAEIAGDPPPAAFAAMWNQDVAAFEKKRNRPATADHVGQHDARRNSIRKDTPMNIASIIGNLKGAFAAKRREKAITVAALAREIASGKTPDPAEVEKALADSGRSLDDLQKEAERLVERRKLREQVAAAVPASKELAAVNQRKAAALARFEEARTGWRDETNPLIERAAELQAIIDQAASARHTLASTTRITTEAADRDTEIGQRCLAIQDRIALVRDTLRENRAVLADLELQQQSGGGAHDANRAKKITYGQASIAHDEAEIKALEDEREELNRERTELHAAAVEADA